MQVLIHRDSKAWHLQVWVSFLLAVFLCGVGLAYLPGKDLDRAFMIMGYFFCLSAAFVLAKFVRDTEKARMEGRSADTPMFRYVVWGGFLLAMALTGWGLLRMEVNETYKAFLGVSWLYLITCTFTLAKTLRDAHEAQLNDARAQGARTARNADNSQ
ncbi:MAG: YiaA/YiaB family inner membrane protein [Pseudomonadota bacterium]